MKKIAFLLCAVAMLASMTSCHKSHDASPNLTPVVIDESRTLIVTVNTPSDITYGGKTYYNVLKAIFPKTADKGKLTITPRSDKYYEQDAMDIDFYDKLTLAVDVQLVRKPTNLVSQEDAKNGTPVTNDNENQNTTGVTAVLLLPEGTDITGNTTDPISITVFEPAETVLQPVDEGAALEANVLVIRVEPAGATFSRPARASMNIANSTGYDIVCIGPDGQTIPMTDQGNDNWNVDLTGAGDWNVYLQAEVTNIVDGAETFSGTSPVQYGDNTISYPVKAGGKELTTVNNELVSTFIEKEFGVYYEGTKDATFTSDGAGTAVWRVTQPYQDITMVSGDKTFVVRVYGEPVFEIVETLEPEQSGHSGGTLHS